MKAEHTAQLTTQPVLPNIKTEEALIGRITDTLNQLADLLDRVLRFPELKEREQLTDRIGGIKRELASVKSRLQRDRNLHSAVRTFNRIYLQLNQLQQDIAAKQNAAVWNKQNRKKAMNRSNKYEQAMEQVVERDNRIKLLSEEAKSLTSENVEVKQLYDEVLQQNHVLKNTLARNEIEFSNLLNENREMHGHTLHLMATLDDTTSRLETVLASDKQNRGLLEKGAAQIKKLSQELGQVERCVLRYEKMLEEKESDVKELSKILTTKEAELIGKDGQLSNKVNEIKHLSIKIETLEEGVMSIRGEYQREIERDRKSHAIELEHLKKDGQIALQAIVKEQQLLFNTLKKEHSTELNHFKSRCSQLQLELQRQKSTVEQLTRWEGEARQLQQLLERTKHEVNHLKVAEEATKATSVYWQEQCGRAKEELRKVNEQLNRCNHELERRIADSHHTETVKDIRISDLEHELKDRVRERDESLRSVEVLQSQLASLGQERQKVVEEKNKYLAEFLAEQSLRKSCQTSLNSANVEVERQKQQRVVVDRELQRISKELVGVERSRIEARSEADSEKHARARVEKQITALENVISKLKGEGNERTEELASTRQQLRKFETELKERANEHRRMEEQLREGERRNEQLKRKELELRESLKELADNERVSRQKKQKDHLNNNQVVMEYISQLEYVKQEYEQYRSSMEEKISYLNGLIDKLNRNVEELDDCIIENRELREDNQTFANQLQEMQEDACQAAEQLNRLRDQNSQLRSQLILFRDENCQINDENIQLHERLEQLKGEHDSQVHQLSDEIDRLRSHLANQAPKEVVRFNRRRVLEDIRRLINE